jgi:hypothetical protein
MVGACRGDRIVASFNYQQRVSRIEDARGWVSDARSTLERGDAVSAGVILSGIDYPEYDAETKRFQVIRGKVLVLTHECDIDPANSREFNTGLLVAPIIEMAGFADTYEKADRKALARSLTAEIAANRVSRVFFLPPPNFVRA